MILKLGRRKDNHFGLWDFTLSQVILSCFILLLTVFNSSAQNKPQIEIAQKIIDLGKVSKNSKVKHTFTIKNVGNSPLLIGEIKTPCGCTVSKFARKPILAGETSEIKVQIDTRGQEGYFHKTITIISNTDPQEFGVTFRLQIEK